MSGINITQLREQIIKPALVALDAYSLAAENLVAGTACVESGCGYFLRQWPAGPALGIFQIEGATHDDIWENFLKHRPRLHKVVRERVGVAPAPELKERLISDLLYGAMMCRVFYLRVKVPLPAADNLPAMAAYWKKHYNTGLGKGTEQKFIEAYRP